VEAVESRLEEVLEALHEGDYRAARARIAAVLDSAPDDPGALFFAAYSRAWQGALHVRDLAADPEFMGALDQVMERSAACGAADGRAGRCALYGGMAAMLQARAHFDKEERSLWRAAADVRRGIRELERAVALGARPDDAAFWTGAYEVMAGSLPLPLRALRGLLGLPSGNRERGIAALERAASPAGRFRLEAALFLAAALGEGPPGGFARALEVLQRALPALSAQGSLMPLFAGELLADWGLTAQARSVWEAALERQRRRVELYSPAEEGRLRYQMAHSLALELRWAEAAAHLHELLAAGAGGSRSLRERATLLLARCEDRMGRRESARALLAGLGESDRARRALRHLEDRPASDPASMEAVAGALERWRAGDRQAGLLELEEAARAYPGMEEALLHAGRAALEAGRGEQAAAHFEALASGRSSTAPSDEALGWALLHLGWIADAAGRRDAALVHYERLRRLSDFEASRAGALFAEIPYPELRTRAPRLWMAQHAAAGAPASGP
jgi:hypothetical protein